eukprot:438603-Rhodomonas_salina.1
MVGVEGGGEHCLPEPRPRLPPMTKRGPELAVESLQSGTSDHSCISPRDPGGHLGPGKSLTPQGPEQCLEICCPCC